jgi:hypothetical protein
MFRRVMPMPPEATRLPPRRRVFLERALSVYHRAMIAERPG